MDLRGFSITSSDTFLKGFLTRGVLDLRGFLITIIDILYCYAVFFNPLSCFNFSTKPNHVFTGCVGCKKLQFKKKKKHILKILDSRDLLNYGDDIYVWNMLNITDKQPKI